MPIGPFRTYSQPVNVSALDRFDDGAEVTPELLAAEGLISSTRKDVKILGNGELSKKLSVTRAPFLRDRAREDRGRRRHRDGAARARPGEAPQGQGQAEGQGRARGAAPPRPARGRAARRRDAGRGVAPRAVLARQRVACPGAPPPRDLHGARCCSSTASGRGCPRRASTPTRSRATSRPAAARSSGC